MSASIRKVPSKMNPYFSALVGGVAFAIGVEAANAITVSLQLQDHGANDLEQKGAVRAYLSSDSGGNALATAPNGGVAAGTDGLVLEEIADQVFTLVSEDDGDIDLVLTDSTVRTVYLNVVLPSGEVVTSNAITWA